MLSNRQMAGHGLSLGAALAAVLTGCAHEQRPDVTAADAAQETARAKAVSDAEVRRIAMSFKAWPRVSDAPKMAPQDCRAPMTNYGADGLGLSRSSDASTHGQKLYFLHASDQASYRKLDRSEADQTAPVGQTLVKQSFDAVEIDWCELPKVAHGPDGQLIKPDYLVLDTNRVVKTGAARELFIMTKLAPETPGTDQGWVYAVTSPDGSRVIDSGRIASCMDCHSSQRHDRLFGREEAQRLTKWLADRAKPPPAREASPPAR